MNGFEATQTPAGGDATTTNSGLVTLYMYAQALAAGTLEEKLAATRRFATSVLPLLVNGKVKPIIEHAYPLEEIGAAHTVMAENKNFGKLIVKVD